MGIKERSNSLKDTDKMPGWNLESVGTHMRADGWTYPMLVDDCNRYRGYAQWAGVHLLDIEPDGDWMTALSDDDRKIVEAIGGKMSHPGKPVTCPECERPVKNDVCFSCQASDYQDEPERGE